jgi:flagellar motility protein MotE (MotC chaperone)
LEQLRERERELDQREVTLRNREEALRTLQTEVEARIAAMELLRQRIGERLELVDRNRALRISALAEMYGGMDPVAAASQLSELETGTIIDILMTMERDPAAYVLEQIEPSKAAEIIQHMSRRE